ncbi:ww domain-containing protein [Colletotrichum musicola]|uniref:Ww domain-containing protein n=1 Tax=Colletotrichum musicola TaxID=2175873 RepID=A0A8H6NX04_9PEZI|nr:ww domain-containing protein [Colletotrichum musicola]
MAGPTSPGTEGPTFAPPHLPAGWIAQWDGSSKKYYFVQLSTGVSQWEVPTDAAPTGATPAQPSEHPYGVPQPELITHPDGSQTVRHADGTLEPVNPPMPPDNTNTRGIDGPTGDRGLGSMAMNALLGGKNSNHGSPSGSHGNSSSPLGGLANQLISGIGGHGSSGSSGGKSSLGKLGGALASSLLNKPSQGQQQGYHGNQSSGHQQHGGLAGSLMGGVANMFGGGKQTHGVGDTDLLLQGNNYGYSNNASSGGSYSGQAPPTSYQPPGSSSQNQHSSPSAGGSFTHSPAPTQGQQHQGLNHAQSYPPPPNQSQSQSFPPPPNQYPPPTNQGQTQNNNSYGTPSHNQSYPPPPVGGPPSSYGQQPQYGGYNPATYGSGGVQGSQGGSYPSQPSYNHNPSQQGGYGNRY